MRSMRVVLFKVCRTVAGSALKISTGSQMWWCIHVIPEFIGWGTFSNLDIQGYSWLHCEFEDNLSYMRPRFKKKLKQTSVGKNRQGRW